MGGETAIQTLYRPMTLHFAVVRSFTRGSFLLRGLNVPYRTPVPWRGAGLGAGTAALAWKNSVADRGKLVD